MLALSACSGGNTSSPTPISITSNADHRASTQSSSFANAKPNLLLRVLGSQAVVDDKTINIPPGQQVMYFDGNGNYLATQYRTRTGKLSEFLKELALVFVTKPLTGLVVSAEYTPDQLQNPRFEPYQWVIDGVTTIPNAPILPIHFKSSMVYPANVAFAAILEPYESALFFDPNGNTFAENGVSLPNSTTLQITPSVQYTGLFFHSDYGGYASYAANPDPIYHQLILQPKGSLSTATY